jgi:hypothetical protein
LAQTPVAAVARGIARLRADLGWGRWHREMTGDVYQKPFPTLTKYVDRLLELGVPGDQIILAALRLHNSRAHQEGTLGAEV